MAEEARAERSFFFWFFAAFDAFDAFALPCATLPHFLRLRKKAQSPTRPTPMTNSCVRPTACSGTRERQRSSQENKKGRLGVTAKSSEKLSRIATYSNISSYHRPFLARCLGHPGTGAFFRNPLREKAIAHSSHSTSAPVWSMSSEFSERTRCQAAKSHQESSSIKYQ